MAKLDDFKLSDFSGGLVTDRSDYEMARNMMKNTRNFEFDDRGRAISRRGSMQFGQTITGKILDNSFNWARITLGTGESYYHLVVTRESTPTLYKLEFSYLTGAITPATTSFATVHDVFSGSSGTLSIEGDLVSYGGKTGSTLSSVTGISKNHAANALVIQLVSLGNPLVNTNGGCYFAALNNLLVINGYTGTSAGSAISTFDGSTLANCADDDTPGGVFATTYRQRIYVVGAGGSDAAKNRNTSRVRISFSDAGDPTAWTLANYFDVEDKRGEGVTGLAVLNDVLLILKTNSLFTYDEVQLKQRMNNVGTYHHRTLQVIDDKLYTFCPAGIYMTNGYSAKKISGPVEKYLRTFKPQYSDWSMTMITNCFSGQFNKKYYLYIGDITEPEVLTDVVLVYDTEKDNWTVFSGWTDFTHFANLYTFGSTNAKAELSECFFAGNATGKYFRLFEDRWQDLAATPTLRGGDITADLISDNSGVPISTLLETPFYDLGNPSMEKAIGRLTILQEQADAQISYRLDKGSGNLSEWKSLGSFRPTITSVSLPGNDSSSYRIAFRISTSSTDAISIFNGIIINDIEAMGKVEYGRKE